MPTINGTAGNDTISGTAESETINGLAGDDIINGGREPMGADVGDEIHGGDGADTITDTTGMDVIFGDGGNDHIIVHVEHVEGQSGSVSAGEGNDVVDFDVNDMAPGYGIDLGGGDDLLNLGFLGYDPLTVTLGSGRDVVRFSDEVSDDTWVRLVDFEAGAGGDALDLMPCLDYLIGRFGSGWDASVNPFYSGHLELRQVGSDVLLYVHPAGAAGEHSMRIAVFPGASVSDFAADNFSGMDPNVSSPTETRLITSDLTIAAGESVAVHDPDFYPVSQLAGNALYVLAPIGIGGNFTNHGSVSVDGPSTVVGFAISAYLADGRGQFLNAADGSFLVDCQLTGIVGNPGGFYNSYGFLATTQAVAFLNKGHFEVRASGGTAYGYHALGGYFGAAFTNSGTFVVTADYEAVGVYEQSSSPFINSGTIEVHGGELAIGVELGTLNGSHFRNTGTITATTDPSSPYASIGVYVFEALDPPAGGAFRHTNSGTITADIAFYVEENSNSSLTSDYLFNSGTIDGAVLLSFGDDTVENRGTMSGRTLLEAGDDRYDGSQGRHSGSVEGGLGSDWLVGGAQSDVLFGDIGDDSLAGGAGDDFLDGGWGDDALDGGAGTDTLSYADSLSGVQIDLSAGSAFDGISRDLVRGFEQVLGSQFADVVTGTLVAEFLLGGAGDDRIDGGGGNDVLRGETGVDELTGGGGNDRFLFSFGDGAEIVRDFAAGDQLEIYGYRAAQSLAQVGSSVVLILSSDDQVTLLNTTVAQVQAALQFSDLRLGDAPAAVSQTIIANGENVVIGEGATVTLTDPAAVDYRHTHYTGTGVILASTGLAPSFSNSGAFVLTDSGASGTVVGLSGDSGGYWNDDSVFINADTGSFSVESASSDAIGVGGLMSIYNLGLVRVASDGGHAVAFTDLRSDANGDTAHFVNAGTIEVEALGRAVGVGQYYGSSQSTNAIYNSGTISCVGGAGSSGIDLIAGAHPAAMNDYLVNSGTIAVSDSTSAKDSAGLFVDWSGDLDIFNSGTISGEYSIKRDYGFSGGPGTLSIYNSGSLIGDIDLLTVSDAVEDRNVLLVNSGEIRGSVRLNAAADIYDGRQGTVTGPISGMGGDDQLLSGVGAQAINGGAGNDLLSGGAGADTMTGASGADVFRYEAGFGIDMITDFNAAGGDRIEVRGYVRWTSIAQVGADVVVTFAAGEKLVFQNQQLGNISATAFTFGAAEIAAHGIPGAPAEDIVPGLGADEDSEYLFPLYGTSSADTFVGTGANDGISGLGGNDVLNGGAGNDRLDGGTGNDRLDGDDGLDIGDYSDSRSGVWVDLSLTTAQNTGGGGTDTLVSIEGVIGSGFNDVISGNAGANVIRGGFGNDVLAGAAGDDLLHGGDGDDTIDGGEGIDTASYADTPTAGYGLSITLYTENAQGTTIAGTDALISIENVIGSEGADWIQGNQEANALSGGAGGDSLLGEGGGDRLDGGSGQDMMVGGLGNDTYVVDRAEDAVTEEEGEGTDTVQSTASFVLPDFVERLSLIGASDINGTGNALNNTLAGNDGANSLAGLEGNDVLNGGRGNDNLDGGAGDDTLNGSSGIDTANYSRASAGVAVSLSIAGAQNSGGAGRDSLVSIENVIGSRYDDLLTGSSGANLLSGAAGADRIFGFDGNDRLNGGAGSDRMIGGAGNDLYYADSYGDSAIEYAGEGVDEVRSSASMQLRDNVENLTLLGSANIWGRGNGSDNVLTGNAAANKLFGLAGTDRLDGGAGNDRLFGGAGDDRYFVDSYNDRAIELAGEGTDSVFASANYKLGDNAEKLTMLGSANLWAYGNAIDNVLSGNTGANKLYGLGGNDILSGGSGNDWLEGGAGQDRLTGGEGADRFVFQDGDFGGSSASTSDRITDFSETSGDTIRLNLVDADTTLAGDQGFAFIGAGAFGGTAGELRYEQINGDTYVQGDTDGDGSADFWIRVDGLHSLTSSDFIF